MGIADSMLWVAMLWAALIIIVLLWRTSKMRIITTLLFRPSARGPRVLEVRPTSQHARSTAPSIEAVPPGKLDVEQLRQQKEKFLKLIETAQQQKGIPVSIRDKLIQEYKGKISDIENRLKEGGS